MTVTAAAASEPTLWHIGVSHYSEKVRWALDYKLVEHKRHAPPPGIHALVALWLTRGRNTTFPVLTVNGRSVGDSTAIIAELEKRFPEPRLYPLDPELRRRALELEDWFDEELGPHIRRFVFHLLAQDHERFNKLAAKAAPGPLQRYPGVAGIWGRAFAESRFRTRSPQKAEQARVKVLEALDRLEEELGSGEYLVGDGFTVADLTAAALLYPIAIPPGAPVEPDDLAETFNRFREPLQDRRASRWVQEMWRRHRHPGAARAGDRAGELAVAA